MHSQIHHKRIVVESSDIKLEPLIYPFSSRDTPSLVHNFCRRFPHTKGKLKIIKLMTTMLPITEEIIPASSTSLKGRRRRNGIGAPRVAVQSLCMMVLVVASVVHGFTGTGTSMPQIGKKVHVESHALVGRKRYQQQLSSRTSSLVLTSSKNAELDGSTINGATPLFSKKTTKSQGISKISATLSKIGMMAFIASMCLALPIALFPPYLLHRLKLISKVKQQNMALANGQFCARWLLRLIPFCNLSCSSSIKGETDPQPSIWVCNHTSALDIFMLLAKDHEMRGKKKRPIKIVYVSMKIVNRKRNQIETSFRGTKI